jgi:prepilin-type N-terminal cleavage/methylation domain-containing protein/prepilin-type processing-associated H-X9-DG protein
MKIFFPQKSRHEKIARDEDSSPVQYRRSPCYHEIRNCNRTHQRNSSLKPGRNMSWDKHARKAFTLIELLVVIAIISLLVSILLPSLQKAKDMAKLVVCASNLRSIGQAEIIYTNSYDGYYTPLYRTNPEIPYYDDPRQTAKWEKAGYCDNATGSGPFPISIGLLTSDKRTSVRCEGILDGDAYNWDSMPKVFFDPSVETMPYAQYFTHYEAVWSFGSILRSETLANNHPMFVCPISSSDYTLSAGPHGSYANALYPDTHVSAWPRDVYEGMPGGATDFIHWIDIFAE